MPRRSRVKLVPATPDELELKKLRKIKDLCVELVKLFEACAAYDEDEAGEFEAYEALFDREVDICRRVMALVPEEFSGGHLRQPPVIAMEDQ